MAGDALHGTSAPSGYLALSPSTHSSYAQHAMPHDWPRVWPPYCSLMQVSWPRPSCTRTRAPPSPPCPVASLTRGIVVQVTSKSYSHSPPADVLTCARLHTSCTPHRGPPCRSSHSRLQWSSASCACTSAMHSRNGSVESSARIQTAYPRNDAVLLFSLPSVRMRNQSHSLARDDDAVDNDRHGKQSKTEIYIRRKPFVPELPHGPCHSV